MKSFKKFLSVQEAKAGYCSDECCGSDVKAEDCPCPPTCAHCDCNAEVNETFDPKHPKVVAARKAHKAGTYDGNVDKNGNAIVHINGKPHTVTKGDPAAKTEAVDEGSIKGSGTDRKSVLKKAYRSGEQDTRQFNTPGGAATNKPKRGSDATVKKAYQAGRDSEHGDSAYKGKRRSKPQDTLGYKKPSYNEAIEEGILDNIKKKANDIRRKVVGPNQAEKDAARKKQMAKQHDSTMARIGSAMSAVAKKDKAAEVARLKQGLKNVQNKRNEETEQLDELSPETLKSYKKKALKQYKQSANKRNPGGGDYGSATKAAQDKHQKRFDKRHKGIGSEIKRTTDSDIHLKDPKGLVRKDPKSNSMTGKPAPYKNRAESKVDEVLDTPKAMDSYRDKAKYSKDKATNSAVANILRKGDHSADLKTRDKREKGLKMADRNATKKTVKALRGESTLDEATINQLTAEYVNEHNITMVELEAMSPEQLDEIIGKALGGIAKAAIKTGAAAVRGGKAATQRVSTAGRADAAEKKADKLEKKKADRDRIQAAKDRVQAAKDSLRNKQAAAAS